MTRTAALSGVAVALMATPAYADHPGAFRIEGMSPLATALITGGLALLVALVVVILIMLLTRPSAGHSDSERK